MEVSHAVEIFHTEVHHLWFPNTLQYMCHSCYVCWRTFFLFGNMYIRVNTTLGSSLRSGISNKYVRFEYYLLLQSQTVDIMKFLRIFNLWDWFLFDLQFILRNFWLQNLWENFRAISGQSLKLLHKVFEPIVLCRALHTYVHTYNVIHFSFVFHFQFCRLQWLHFY